jgi:hypothetical protein
LRHVYEVLASNSEIMHVRVSRDWVFAFIRKANDGYVAEQRSSREPQQLEKWSIQSYVVDVPHSTTPVLRIAVGIDR